jgi:AcrR family transcriptional regulator
VPQRARQPRKTTLRRRAKVLGAALRCFTRRGLAATTIGDIRKASNTSIGSIYHHFASKEDLVADVYVHALELYQEGLIAKLARTRSAQRGVRTIVEYHLDWVSGHADHARFLFTAEHPPPRSDAARALSELNRRFFDRLFRRVEAEMRAGAIRSLPRDLFWAMVVGPAESYARAWLEGRRRSPLGRARRALADGAWAAVRSRR